MNIVKLVSGGIDSYIMSQEYDGINVYIDFGQKYAQYEKKALQQLQVQFEEINIKSSFKEKNFFIPDRNLTFATLIAMIYQPDVIMMAGLIDDNCVDKNPEAFKKMSDIISEYAGKKIIITSPYFNKTKGQLIQNFKHKEKLIYTFSCYTPNSDGSHCGNCPACLRKAIALETNGISCNYTLTNKIINEYLLKIHTYNQDRISRFFFYLNKYKPIYAIDIDGILCKEQGPFQTRKPFKKNIDYINSLQGYIILYTSRLETDRNITIQWLNNNKVKYHSLIMNKLPYYQLIDDRSINFIQLKE